MESNLLSISKIFTERIFRIPDYQRGYAWTEKQLKDFYNDLIQIEKGKNHYTGVLTLENVPEGNCNQWHDDLWIIESRGYSPYYIVDGQQRLTTTIILIKSILETTEKFGEQFNYSPLSDIERKFIFDSKDKGVSRSYIFGYDKDNPSYEFLKTEIFKETSETSSQKQETIYTSNLIKAKEYFLEKLEDKSKDELELLYRNLTQHFLFNIYTITTDIDTFIAFETMNNRGKELSLLELLKNRLIYLSTKLSCDIYDKQRLRKKINECWKSVYHNLGKNKDNPLDDDKFLFNHFLTYFNHDREQVVRLKRSTVSGSKTRYSKILLEEKFTLNNIKLEKLDLEEISKYVDNLQLSVKIWYEIFNPFDSNFDPEIIKYLDKINRLNDEKSPQLILTFFHFEKKKNTRIEFLKSYERLLFIKSLGNYRSSMFRSFWSDLYDLSIKLKNKEIDSDKLIQQIKKNSKDLLDDDSIDALIRQFRQFGFYRWRGCKYFLFEYDYFLFEISKTERNKLNWNDFVSSDYNTIEHIYPQKPKADCWKEPYASFSLDQRIKLQDSLGNLLPLSNRKNSSLGNKCFKDKVGNSKNTVGYRYGCYAENEITNYNQWTSKEILERGIKLLDFMEKRWKIKIGDSSKKKEMLGLDFLSDEK